MLKLGLLGSTRGTHVLTLSEAIDLRQIKASIEIILSDRPDALILERAKAKGYKTACMRPQGMSREDYDKRVSQALKTAKVDLILLIGFMRLLSSNFVDEWENRILNIHPSLLPAFAGKMDQSVHQAVLDSGIKETGCTLHYVTSEVDSGPILVQKKCPVLASDTVESLKARVQALEGEALIEGINLWSRLMLS